MAQEVVILHTETHIGTAVEVVSAVKRQLPKTNLGRDTRKPFLYYSCFRHTQGPKVRLLCFPRKCPFPQLSADHQRCSEHRFQCQEMKNSTASKRYSWYKLQLLPLSMVTSWLPIHLWKVFLCHLTRQITRWRWSLLHAVGTISILELRTSLLLGTCNNIKITSIYTPVWNGLATIDCLTWLIQHC